MRALLRKDRWWMVSAAAAGAVLHFMTLVGWDARHVWIYPSTDYVLSTIALFGMFAFVLGLWASVHEELFRTGDYLAHRPVSPRAMFVARHAGGLCAVAVWVAIPLVSFLAYSHATMRDWNSMFEQGRLPVYLAMQLATLLPCYALGALAGVVAPRVVASLLIGIAIVGGVIALGLLIGEPPLDLAYGTRALLVGVSVTLVLLIAAYYAAREPRDADRPWAPPRLLAAPILAFLSVAAAGALSFVGVLVGQELLFEQYPMILERDDRTLGLARNERDGQRRRLIEVDAQHSGIAEVPMHDRKRIRWERVPTAVDADWWGPPIVQHRAFLRNPRPVPCGRAECRLSRDQRNLLELSYAEDGVSRRIGKPAGAPPFSDETLIVGAWHDPPTIILGDPADGTLWWYRREEGPRVFEPMALPGGDKFVAVVAADEKRRFYGAAEDPSDVFVRGERGFYTIAVGALVAVSPEIGAELERRWRDRRLAELVVLERDPITFTVEARPLDGRPPFRHLFSPRTGWERAAAGLMYLSSLVRPPVLHAAAIPAQPASRPWDQPAVDVMVAGGKRPAILFVVFLSAFAFAALTYRRLQRVGAPNRDRIVWTATALLTGWVGWGLARLLAPDRAFRGVPASVIDAVPPPLLLESA